MANAPSFEVYLVPQDCGQAKWGPMTAVIPPHTPAPAPSWNMALRNPDVDSWTYTRLYIDIYVFTHIHMFRYVCMYVSTYIYVTTCICTKQLWVTLQAPKWQNRDPLRQNTEPLYLDLTPGDSEMGAASV